MGVRWSEMERSCFPLACRWHVVNLPGLRGKRIRPLHETKTPASFVGCLGKAGPPQEDKITKRQNADRRDGRWSKG